MSDKTKKINDNSKNRYKNRSNLWAFIIYPDDSLPKNYLDIIRNEWIIPTLLSPVHDSDFNADDSQKKKHIHVMMYFGVGINKSFDQVKEYSNQLNGSNPIIVHNREAMIRYFIHLDNPEKHQYKREDLLCFHGFEIGNAFDSWSNDEQIYDYIENLIYDHFIYNFSDLVRFLRDFSLYAELSFLRRHTIYFKSLLDGQFQKKDALRLTENISDKIEKGCKK